jgi:hypothetical protein
MYQTWRILNSLLMKGAMLHETPTTQANVLDDSFDII